MAPPFESVYAHCAMSNLGARILVAAWIITSVLIFGVSLKLGARQSIPGPASVDTISRNAAEARAIAAGVPPRDTLFVVLSGAGLAQGEAELSKTVEDLKNTLLTLQAEAEGRPLFRRILTMGSNSWLFDDSFFRSSDKLHVLLKADLDMSVTESARPLAALPGIVTEWQTRHPDFQVNYLSGGTVDNEIVTLINNDLDRSLLYTVPLTLLVLLGAFGSVIGALIPLVVAVVSLLASLGGAAILSHVVGPISATAEQLVVLFVLALGVDYSLLTLNRLREERLGGLDFAAALAVARDCSGRAVFWSGTTVALSIVGLFVMDDSVLSSMALVSLLAVVVTMMSCILVLPAILWLLGDRIDSGRLPIASSSGAASLLKVCLKGSLAHPWRVAIITTMFLVALSGFGFRVQLGSTIDPKFLPSSMQSVAAHRLIADNFPNLSGTQFSLIFYHPKLSEIDDEDTLQPVIERLVGTEGVKGPFSVERANDGSVVRYHMGTSADSTLSAKQEIARKIRQDLAPELQRHSGIELGLSGLLPYEVDTKAHYAARTPLAMIVVLAVSFLLLTVAFRSIVVPLKAVLLNLLSTGVSFGVLALVFESGVIPGWNYGVIETFVPALLFSILFGLSMDYHVFLLSRIRDLVLKGADTETAVREGILATSGTITSAALIMAVVFCVMATLELPILKQLGVGLAVAVLVDATIIRSLLLPASMQILGAWNWYLPGRGREP